MLRIINKRTSCACDKCKAACKSMPGMLAPGDFEDIQENTGSGDESFVASEGALVSADGATFRIPTITPAQQADGRCVFLSADDKCTIHKFAPYGCRYFNVCDGPEAKAIQDARSIKCLSGICRSETYLAIWERLRQQGLAAPPLDVRRAHLSELLKGTETCPSL